MWSFKCSRTLRQNVGDKLTVKVTKAMNGQTVNNMSGALRFQASVPQADSMAGALKRNQAHMAELGSLLIAPRGKRSFLHKRAARLSDSPAGGRERSREGKERNTRSCSGSVTPGPANVLPQVRK